MNLRPLFTPRSVAVVGVSTTTAHHPANVIYNKLHLRSPAAVYGVNPRGGTYQRQPLFPSVDELPEAVDLAVIAVPAEAVPAVLEACIRRGIGGATIISGGFAEAGRADLEERLRDTARAAGFPFLGPNCLGIYVPGGIDTFFLPTQRLVRPAAGNVALVSQSGGVLVDQMVKFARENIGLSLGVSIGNKALIRELDLLDHLAEDPRTEVIAFYIEGFAPGEGRAFVQAAARCAKPVIVLKAGKSAAGSRAVRSHTAALAGDYAVFRAVMAQFGVVEARDEGELVAFCESLSYYPTPICGRIGIVSGSGGHGALAVDACTAHRLAVPALDDAWQADLRDELTPSVRPIASLANPIDLTGSAVDEDFVATVTALSRSPQIECVIALLLPYIPGITADLGARLSQVRHERGKPLLAYVPNMEKYGMLIEGFELNGVPVSHSIEGAVLMAEAMRRSQPC